MDRAQTVVTPVLGGRAALRAHANPPLVKAVARAFRYQKLLDVPVRRAVLS